ncbi:hypothetical protein EV426DRAFT_594191 [Tirmania nivea]|nr:hypothetical protein EV426DRAFT_594191 [Tirmania nivea]
MPPKPKKKKLPTRGVMTTSAPSKAQTAAAAAEAEAKQQAEIESQPPSAIPENDPVIGSWEQAVLSGQDAREAALKGLLEKLGPKVKKESQKWIEKLATERRMLRTVGAGAGLVWPLYVEGLLGLHRDAREDGNLGLGERIFELAKKEADAAWKGRESKPQQDEPAAEALLAQAWMIFRALTSLGFPEGKVEKAIEEVIGKGKVGLVSGEWERFPSSMIGTLRGGEGVADLSMGLLEEVMDWLGMECEEDELPRFDGVVREKRKDGEKENGKKMSPKEQVAPSGSGAGFGATTPILKDNRREISKKETPIQSNRSPFKSQIPSGQQTPKYIPSSKLSLEPLDIEDAGLEVEEGMDIPCENPSVEEDGDSDGDDIPPEELLPKWLELRRKLLRLDPTTAFGGSKNKGLKAVEDPKVKSLKGRTQKIERDPFFDTRLAGDAWAKEMTKMKDTGELQAVLTQEGQGRRWSKKKNDWWAEKNMEKIEPEPVTEAPLIEDDGMFGGLEMFEAPRTEELLTGTEERIVIRDFEQAQNTAAANAGKFDKSAKNKLQANTTAAVQVRKVVEEVVKSKDPRARVTFTSTSDNTYSSRHSLAIRWSKLEHLTNFLKSSALPTSTPTPCPLTSAEDVMMRIDEETVTFSMTKLSAPSSAQSEAYISTVVLYQLYGGSTCAGGKGYIRLQGVWTDLWAEFAERDKAEEERAEREILGKLRKMVLSEGGEKRRVSAKELRKKRKTKENGEGGVEDKGEQVEGERNPLADWEKKAVGEDLREEWEERVNSRPYRDMLDYRKQLPIWSFKDEILNALDKEQVIIICGETGCGKSTQVPAFILENELSNGRACRVYCTEPRRISTISLARRVSQELGDGKSDLGTKNSLVGYAIRLESCMGSWTRLVYATSGIVMRMLQRSPTLDDVTHLVLDEVHERSIDSDFLLIVLKKLLSKRKNLKVILMSATVDSDRFSRYLNSAPVLNVPGRTFPVTTQFLEDAIELTKFTIDERDAQNKKSSKYSDEWDDGRDEESNEKSNPTLTVDALSNYSKETKTALSKINENKIQYELIVKLIEVVAITPQYVDYSRAILVFLPGIGEIRKLNDYLLGSPIIGGYGTYGDGKRNGGQGAGGDRGWLIYLLHSTVASEEQEAAFLVPPKGMRKIVLATNIAETGITIPDVTCVIDSGKHKEMRFDERRQLSRLIETFISRANAKQRRGRAGRVQEGLCFHLFTKERYESFMAPQQTPELLRLSLQDLCLRVKVCNLGPIEETLLMALDPPLPKNIRRAIDSLIEAKALTSSEELTYLGLQLSKLPLDVYLGKLILHGWVHGCLDAAITIAAILSSKSPFQAPMGGRRETESAKLEFKKGDSDLQTIYNAYCAWRRICSGLSQNLTENQFCQRNYLSSRTLNAIEDLKGQLITCVVDAGFLSLNRDEKQSLARSRFQSFRRKYFFTLPTSVDPFSENENIVNSVIAAGFYPKLLVRDGRGWRNIANNQTIQIYPGSVNRRNEASTWLSYYRIMQSNVKFYDAYETSHVDDLAIALLCGEVDFRGFAGVLVVDGHRIKFCLGRWKGLLAVKILRGRLGAVSERAFRDPEGVNRGRNSVEGREKVVTEKEWVEIVGEVLGVRRKVTGA